MQPTPTGCFIFMPGQAPTQVHSQGAPFTCLRSPQEKNKGQCPTRKNIDRPQFGFPRCRRIGFVRLASCLSSPVPIGGTFAKVTSESSVQRSGSRSCSAETRLAHIARRLDDQQDLDDIGTQCDTCRREGADKVCGVVPKSACSGRLPEAPGSGRD
jgi:hypothetical protein